MTRFEIESLQPIGGDFWKAKVSVGTPETIEDREFAQWATLTIRFKYHLDGNAEGLLQRALDEARRCLSLSSAYLQDHALPELMAEIEPKPFEWDYQPPAS